VAVVIPAYQAEQYLEVTVRSLLEQTWTAWEGIVVDDGSTDATAAAADALARADARVRVVHQANAGVSAARNRGLQAVSPGVDYVTFLDSDDLLLPDALETLVGALQARPDAVGASAWAEYVDDDGRPVAPGAHAELQRRRRVPTATRARLLGPGEDTTFASLALRGSIWPPATALVRLPAARRTGGFNPDLSNMEDWDFFLRLARQGPLVFVDRQVAWYRRRPGNNRANTFAASAAKVRALAYQASLDPGERRALRRAHRWYHLVTIKNEGRAALRDLRTGRPAAAAVGMAWVGLSALEALGGPGQPNDARYGRLTRLDLAHRSAPDLAERTTGAGSARSEAAVSAGGRGRAYELLRAARWAVAGPSTQADRPHSPVELLASASQRLLTLVEPPTPVLGRLPAPPPFDVVSVYRSANALRLKPLLAGVDRRAACWALDRRAGDDAIDAVTIGSGPGSRFANLNRALDALPGGGDRWLVVVDDDVEFTRGDLGQAVALADLAGLDLAQPSHDLRSYLNWSSGRHRPGSVVRLTRYVDQGPLIILSPAARAMLTPFPEDLGMGWGIEARWAAQGELRIGVLDGVMMRHLGAVRWDGSYDIHQAMAQADRLLHESGWSGWGDLQAEDARWRSWQPRAPWHR
jgi:glycosyltransferase involved in cell wall biosynthesis